MIPEVDHYLVSGCGRCKLYDTPQCKVHKWHDELHLLRSIVAESELTEELKWSMPCYTYQKKNVLMIAAFKEYCCISFFKGSLLKDSQNILTAPGENSQAVRQARFTDIATISELESILKAYIQEAIEIEKSGKKVEFKEKSEQVLCDELQEKLSQDATFEKAFSALTPGRQRAYNLFFTAPKHSKTRYSRIEKCTPDILQGKGLNGR